SRLACGPALICRHAGSAGACTPSSGRLRAGRRAGFTSWPAIWPERASSSLACLADHEFSQWASVDLSSVQSHEKAAAEMAQRALAELESYYVIGVGHALANMTGRVLALDPGLHQHLVGAKYIQTALTPFSNARPERETLTSD